MALSIFNKVQRFRNKMRLQSATTPTLPTPQMASFHARFVMEETSELLLAVENHDLVKAVDAWADTLYVVLGLGCAMGIPMERVFDTVHAANMRKIPGVTKRHPNDVVKPDGWVGPEAEIKKILYPPAQGELFK